MITHRFQISASLMEVVDGPVDDLPVMFEGNEIGRSRIDKLGMCEFQVDDGLGERIEIRDLLISPIYVKSEAEPAEELSRKVHFTEIAIVERIYFDRESLAGAAACFGLFGMNLEDAVTDGD